MNTAILQALRDARAKIEDPAKWTKGDYWSTSYGARTFSSAEVCTMCSLGAILCATGVTPDDEGANEVQIGAYNALTQALPSGEYYVADYNDDSATTHADVLAMFDRAIATQEAIIAKELASGK